MAGGLQPPVEEQDPAVEYATKGGVYFILEDADLQVGKLGKEFRLLNSDEHANYLQRKQLDPSLYRPDICHQALLSILDSPLNKAGVVKGVYVRTKQNTLIQVNPQVRLPRTFRRFSGLMVQLLQKLSVRASNSKDRLLKVVKHPVTKYLPTGATRIALSHKAPEVKDVFIHVKELPQDTPVVFIVGAFASGKVNTDYADQEISISQYPLSAAQALTRITNACEQHLQIV